MTRRRFTKASMKLIYLGKAVLPLRIMAVLLVIQSYMLAPFFPAGIAGEDGQRHPCGCLVKDAASGKCGCAARGCCSCCAGGGKDTLISCHRRSKNSTTICFRVAPCGGREESAFNSLDGDEFYLTDFALAIAAHSVFLARIPSPKPIDLSFKPLLPPPERTTPSAPFLI